MTNGTAHISDIRSRRFAFVPFCLFCQAFQAQGLVKKYPSSIKPVVEELLDHEVNIIQLPCPEARFGDYESGLRRKPHSYAWYDTPEFREHCIDLSKQTVEMMRALLNNGYEISAVLGIEYSPSCSVALQYAGRRGTVRRSGIFMAELKKEMKRRNIETSFVGINRRGIQKTVERINSALSG